MKGVFALENSDSLPHKLKWYDQDHLDWTIKNINKKKGTPYYMANEELADKIFPFIKEEFPDAIMIKLGIDQFIAVNKRSKNALIKRLNIRKEGYEQCIKEIDSAILSIKY